MVLPSAAIINVDYEKILKLITNNLLCLHHKSCYKRAHTRTPTHTHTHDTHTTHTIHRTITTVGYFMRYVNSSPRT